MFVILLRFSEAKDKAATFLAAHKAWIAHGFDDGVFLVVGNLEPGLGGAIVAANSTRDEIETRVKEDPFVVENVVRAEIIEITPGRTDARLAFLSEPKA